MKRNLLIIDAFDWFDNKIAIMQQMLYEFGKLDFYVALELPFGMVKIIKIDGGFIKKHYVKPEKFGF